MELDGGQLALVADCEKVRAAVDELRHPKPPARIDLAGLVDDDQRVRAGAEPVMPDPSDQPVDRVAGIAHLVA